MVITDVLRLASSTSSSSLLFFSFFFFFMIRFRFAGLEDEEGRGKKERNINQYTAAVPKSIILSVSYFVHICIYVCMYLMHMCRWVVSVCIMYVFLCI